MLTRPRVATLVCVVFLALLPLALFASVTLGDRTLLPADNLFSGNHSVPQPPRSVSPARRTISCPT